MHKTSLFFVPLLFIGMLSICVQGNLRAQSPIPQHTLNPDHISLYAPATLRFLGDFLSQDLDSPSPDFIEEYALYKTPTGYQVGVLLLTDPLIFNAQQLKKEGIWVGPHAGNIVPVRVPLQQFNHLASNFQGIQLIDLGDPVSPHLQHSVTDIRADSVYHALGGLQNEYTGKGVIIAVIDWGFDYTSPVFRDSTLENLRIVRAWDQNKEGGPAPQGYDFGTEYATKEALLEAQEDTLYLFGPGSHGTHVAGIAGGSGAGTPHKGIAFESDLIFISLRRDAPSLINAFTYVRDYAQSVGKPFVINMSFGTHLGPHDGTDLKNWGIDQLTGRGRIFVGSAGNNGSAPFHLKHRFNSSTDTLKTVVGFTAHPEYYGQTLTLWGSEGATLSAKLKLLGQQNSVLLETPTYVSDGFPIQYDTFIVDQTDTLLVRLTATRSFVTNGKPNLRIEVRKTSSRPLLLEVSGTPESELHIWNNVRLTRRYTNWGVALSATYPGAKAGDIDYGVGEPGGVGKSVITVASHYAERILPNGQLGFGFLSTFTSKGPTVDGRRKPDISGPGDQVISAVNSFDPNPGNIVDRVEFEGKEFPFAPYSGTSMSGPTVAGIVALMLQANPTLDAKEVKNMLIQSKRLDRHTGDIGDTAHLRWGHGKVNAYGAVVLAEQSDIQPRVEPNEALVYPNPTQDQLTIRATGFSTAVLFDLNGKQIQEYRLRNPHFNSISVSDLSPGMYVIRLESPNHQAFAKFIKQ